MRAQGQQRIPRIQRNEEIPVREGQILDGTRQHCIKTRHESGKEVAAWAQETLPEITDCEHSLLCHPQMEVKLQTYREESICEHDKNAQSKCKK